MMTKYDQLRMAIHAEIAPYNAFSGAAYGKKEMPIAITAGIAAGSAMAAGAAVTAAGVAAVVAGTAVAAGLTMTIVGMATGDKELIKIGGYVGLAGGLAGAGLNMAGYGASTFAAQEAAAVANAAGAAETAATAGIAAAPIASGSALAQSVTPAFESVANPIAQTGATLEQVGGGALQQLTPAFESTTGSTGAITGALRTAPNAITNATQNAIAPTMSELGATAIKAAPTIAGAAGSVASTGATAAKGAGSLFDFISTPGGVTLLGNVATGIGGAITGSAQNDIYKNKIAFDQQQAAYQAANANAIAPYTMTTTPLTDAQRQQANIDKYNQAKKAAGILTNTQQAVA